MTAYRPTLGAVPGATKAAIAITAALCVGVGAWVAYALITGDDGHGPVPWEPTRVETLEVCPSGAPWAEDVAHAAAAWVAEGWRALDVRPGTCATVPEPGVVQVRDLYDVVSSCRPDAGTWTEQHPGTVCWQGRDRGVLYVEDVWRGAGPLGRVIREDVGPDSVGIERRPPTQREVVVHEVGHVLGLGHSTRATSVMHPWPGTSFDDVGVDDVAP